jgi:hypothetical protein
MRRFDVTAGGAFAGSMTTVLPASAGVTTTDQIASDPDVWSKVWRNEIRYTGAAAASHLWITVFDLASNSAQVANVAPLTGVSGAITGTVLQSSTGNSAMVFGTALDGTAIPGTFTYNVPTAQTRHVITDLASNGAYTVTVSVAGANHVVTVTAGGAMHASANGVLTFSVTPAGVIQP